MKKMIAGILVGGAVSAVATMLTTPKSGSEIRNDLKENSETMKEKTKEQYAETKETLALSAMAFQGAVKETLGSFENEPVSVGKVFNDIKTKYQENLHGEANVESSVNGSEESDGVDVAAPVSEEQEQIESSEAAVEESKAE